MKKFAFLPWAALFLAAAFTLRAAEQPLTVAVFDFECKEADLREAGPQLATLTAAQLSADPRLILVERAELAHALGEQELSLSGTVSADTAAKVGQLTGAKVLVTGRLFRAGKETLVVAKIISTETSRVYGEVVKGPGNAAVSDLSGELAQKIATTLAQKGDTLVAKVKTQAERVAELKKELKAGKLPVVYVKIPEQHFGRPVIDPAAETELSLYLRECGFTLADSQSTLKPEIEFVGEAFSELGMRKGNLISCRARVEIKAIERATGKILVVDRQTAGAVDLSEHVAAKAALQEAAARLAERIIPKVVK